MPVRNAIRWIVALAWLACALLLERILTLGGITDLSQVADNPLLFVVVGGASIVAAVAISIATMLGLDGWAALSLPAGIAYALAGVWLRLANNDDSGLAIAVLAAVIAGASWRYLDIERRAKPGNGSS